VEEPLLIVTAALDPAISGDPRVKPGDDEDRKPEF
jgi:hypothetical protein